MFGGPESIESLQSGVYFFLEWIALKNPLKKTPAWVFRWDWRMWVPRWNVHYFLEMFSNLESWKRDNAHSQGPPFLSFGSEASTSLNNWKYEMPATNLPPFHNQPSFTNMCKYIVYTEWHIFVCSISRLGYFSNASEWRSDGGRRFTVAAALWVICHEHAILRALPIVCRNATLLTLCHRSLRMRSQLLNMMNEPAVLKVPDKTEYLEKKG